MLLDRMPAGGPDPVENSILDLLGRWVALGEIERRAFAAMTEELTATAALIENSTTDLSHRFRDLAEGAEAQTGRVERIAHIARTIEVQGKATPLTEATRFVQSALGQAVDSLGAVASQAARMAQALGQVSGEVAGAEECVSRIEAINKQARFVALNAAIEAQRAEGAGGTFKVIARELKDLALETDATSRLVRERIVAVARGVRGAQAELEALAGADHLAQQRMRARLDSVLQGIVAQHQALEGVLEEALDSSTEIAATVARLITGAQFQDRANQHLSHLKDAVEVIGEATGALQQHTREALPSLPKEVPIDAGLLARMLEVQSLSSVRQRFLARLMDNKGVQPEESGAAGDVELF
ncbi:methyl-accepting chemotaxis protein [Muricoccus vinaceus]|uniref:Methyl-accepting chemotaxis protein n=1 Tax=Muricoccus vinaceus TaxID=424704 RepID=A0ABV6IMK2_9PROT